MPSTPPTDPKLWQAAEQAVAPLSTAVPMLLLPVRLETRWIGQQLLIRVYPDVPHTDSLERALAPDERTAGEALWSACTAAKPRGWQPSDGMSSAPPKIQKAWRDLVASAGAWRAAWIVRVVAGRAIVGDETTVPLAALLPACWAFALQIPDKPEIRAIGAPIKSGLRLMPDFSGAADPFADPSVRWLSDFPEAERAGMAVRLDIPGPKPFIASLTVVGVYTTEKTELQDVQAQLDRLLESHRYSRGATSVDPGTPTNTTDEAAAAALKPDPDALWLREHPPARLSKRPEKQAPAPALEKLPSQRSDDLTGGLLAWFDADDDDRKARRAMQTALWPITWGRFFRELRTGDGKPLIGEQHLAALADHFRDHTHGDGVLPIVRLGAQPYGVLPVAALDAKSGTFAAGLATTLTRLRVLWRRAALQVPRLDPAADDAATGRTPAFARVVNTHPWPRRYALRRTSDALLGEWSERIAEVASVNLKVRSGPVITQQLAITDVQFRTALTTLTTADTLDVQRKALAAVRAALETALQQSANALSDEFRQTYEPPVRAARTHVDKLIASLNNYYKRLEDPLQIAGTAAGLTASFPALAVTAGRHATDDGDRSRWTRPVVSANRGFLTALAATLRKPGRAHTPDNPLPGGLLDELLQAAARAVPEAEHNALADAIDELIAAPDERLERLLAGTLSLATTRLDAWITSFAARRLAELRKDTPRGLWLGAYGYLEGLAPGPTPGDGYVLTPSLAQANTAAVLRSAFNTYGGAATSPFNLDLSSRRVEAARALISAMNGGARLADLLGQLAEQLVHADHRDNLIDTLRNWSAGAPDRPTDGLKLARALRSGDGLPANLKPLEAPLAPLKDLFDAIADVGVFDATHHVLQRDSARAGAVLEALDRGELAPRPPTSLDTPRSGALVRHHLVALLPGGAGTGWGTRSLSARLAPPLERWAAHWLGPPAQIFLELRWRRGEATGVLRRSLVGTVGALDFVRLSVAPDQLAESPLAQLLTRTADLPPDAELVALDPSPTNLPAGALSLADAAIIGHGLRGLLTRARPLGPADLPGADRNTETAVPALVFAPATAAWLVDLAADLRTLAIAGLEPAISGLAADPATHQTIAADLRARLAAMATGSAAALEAVGLAWVPALTALADPLPGSAAVTAEQVQSWLAGLARVRPACATLESTLRHLDAVRDAPAYTLAAVQSPGPAEAWVGMTRPTTAAPEWRSWAVLRPAGLTAGPQFGLVLDDWTERIPARDGVAGVAFHWNAPAARAPQAFLLALPNKRWSLADLVDLVRDTMENARMRLVEQEHLDTFADLLPAVFLRGPLSPGGPQLLKSDFNRDLALMKLLEKP